MKNAIFIIILLLSINSVNAQNDEQRYYYNFRTKTLYSDENYTKKVTAPLKYKSGRDINIEIKHFNPLKYEVSVDESSSQFFLNDTAK